MRPAASYLFGAMAFCVIVLTALSVVPAASEGIGPAGDAAWKKFCLDDVCHVGRGRRDQCGLIGDVTIVERKVAGSKRLFIGLPAHVTPDRGSRTIRVTIDGNRSVSREISRCDCACWVYDKGGWDLVELVEQLKQGQWLVLEALTSHRQPHVVVLPLAGFAEAYDGPPTPMPDMKMRSASQ